DADGLDIGLLPADIEMPAERAPDALVSGFVVNGIDGQDRAPVAIAQCEQPPVADQAGAEKLRDEALVAVIGPYLLQNSIRIAAARNVGKPLAVLFARVAANAADILHHAEAEGIRVDA